MKRFLGFAAALFMVTACAETTFDENSSLPSNGEAKYITVAFDNDDTRIQLNGECKTVWTKDDAVSVFYHSDKNTKWVYEGETGARSGRLTAPESADNIWGEDEENTSFDDVVVVYPYDYYHSIDEEGLVVTAKLPATQDYLANSYGVGANLMVAASETSNFTLRNACGWLKLQLTGNGEVVKEVIFRGNSNEQVAGTVYVTAADASLELAAEDDSYADVQHTVTLKCGEEGVVLSEEATAFYITLPPQTFEDGFTVDVVCDDNSRMVKSSNRALTIERNHIQPMATLDYAAEPFYITSESIINASYKGHSGTIGYGILEVVEGQAIEAVADVEWITVTVEESEEGDVTVNYLVAPAADTEPRTGVITLSYGEYSDSVTVEQAAGVHAFNLFVNSTNEYNYEMHEVTFGYELSLPVEGQDVEVTLSEEVDWITELTNNYDGAVSVSGNISFIIPEHIERGDRSVTMTISYGETSYDVLITQIDNFPDDVVMDLIDVSASVVNTGTAKSPKYDWTFTLIEQDALLGNPTSKIVIATKDKNLGFLVDDTYVAYKKNVGIRAGNITDGSGSIYRYNVSGAASAIADADRSFTIEVDEENETAKISGVFVSQQYNAEAGKYTDVRVVFSWDGPVRGFRYGDLSAEVTEWKSMGISWSQNYGEGAWAPNHTQNVIMGTAADGTNVKFTLYSYPRVDTTYTIIAGTYPVEKFEPRSSSSNNCDAGDSYINNYKLVSGSIIVEDLEDGQQKLTYDVVDELGINSKGVYIGTLENLRKPTTEEEGTEGDENVEE